MLKPCPFCGKDVYMEKRPMWRVEGSTTRGYTGAYEFIIQCTNPECGCNVKLGKNSTLNATEEEAREEAIKHWNRRSISEITITDPITDPIHPFHPYPNPSPTPWSVQDICVYAGPTLPEDYWTGSKTSTNDNLTMT